MPIRVVESAPPAPRLRRLARALLWLGGTALSLVGVFLGGGGLILLTVTLVSHVTGSSSFEDHDLALAGYTLFGILAYVIGERVRRRRRNVVLFLRRFGFDDSSAALTAAVNSGLGRRWRLVTLDDASTQAQGVPVAERRGIRAA